MRRLAPRIVALTLAVACSGRDESKLSSREAASGEPARAPDSPAALIDSANHQAARGDTYSATLLLAQASLNAAGNPPMEFRVGVAQQRIGDVLGATRTYRRYLSRTPEGSDVAAVRDRLLDIVGGGRGVQIAVSGAPAPVDSTTTRTPAPTSASTSASASAATSAPTRPRRSAAVVSERRARVRVASKARRRAAVAAARAPAAAPLARSAPSIASAPPETSVVVVGANDQRLPTTRAETTLVEVPKVHYTRWSRMQYWFVARLAALGGTGGVVLGAVIGNVPGALAVGFASGAAGGLAKVHQDKVDSARAIKDGRIAARVVHLVRDTLAGEVDLRPDSSARTSLDSARRVPPGM